MAEETFLRTPTQARGKITDEERRKIEEVSKKWMQIGLRTDPIEPEKIEPRIKGLYNVAKLAEPRVLVVSSPVVATISGALSVGVQHVRNIDKDHEVSDYMMEMSLRSITGTVQNALNLNEVVMDNVYASINTLTQGTARRSKPVKIKRLTKDESDNVNKVSVFFLKCLQRWWHMYQGGNMWPGASSYLESMRDVIGLTGLPGWDAYKWWEECAIHGGFRIVHHDFCLVADFPDRIQVDEQARQHSEDGPSHRWRDGWSLWHHHGIMVDSKIIEHPDEITIDEIRKQENAEIRRVMITRLGWDKFVERAKVVVIHRDSLETNFPTIPVSELVEPGHRLITTYRAGREEAELIKCDELTDFEGRPLVFIRLTDPSTGRRYTMRTYHDQKRCYAAVGKSFNGMSEEAYRSGKYLRQGDVMLQPLDDNPRVIQQHS